MKGKSLHGAERRRERRRGMDVGGVQIAGYLFSRISLPLRQTSSGVHVKWWLNFPVKCTRTLVVVQLKLSLLLED